MSYVSTSVVPLTLGDGRMVGPDDSVGRIDPENETNRRLIESGRLLEVKAKNQPKKETSR